MKTTTIKAITFTLDEEMCLQLIEDITNGKEIGEIK